MKHRSRASWTAVAVATLALTATLAHADPAPVVAEAIIDLSDRAEAARAAHEVPAIAVAWVRDGQVVGAGVAGVRKNGDETLVTIDDQWHLGSCTKAMTATLAGILVERGVISWDTTIAEALPEIAEEMKPAYRDATLKQLLSHRAGLPSDRAPTPAQLVVWNAMRFSDGDLAKRRMVGVRAGLVQEPIGEPGAHHAYSNLGYTIAAAMLEHVTKKSYEELMQEEIFGPLGMDSAGWGAPGTPGRIDQPVGHSKAIGGVTPVSPGSPVSDNPDAIAPAGTAHMSITDWARFIAAHARAGRDGLLATPETYQTLHTVLGDDYALGWAVTQRPWGNGDVLVHSGSNGLWLSVVWVGPGRQSAYLAVCNIADQNAAAACDQVISSLILDPPPAPESVEE